jgi:hypothetical protein
MKTVKTGQLFIALIVIKWPIFFDCLSSNMSSFAATFSVGVNGKALGNIELTVEEDFLSK